MTPAQIRMLTAACIWLTKPSAATRIGQGAYCRLAHAETLAIMAEYSAAWNCARIASVAFSFSPVDSNCSTPRLRASRAALSLPCVVGKQQLSKKLNILIVNGHRLSFAPESHLN